MYDPSSPFTTATPFKPTHKADFAEERLCAAIHWCDLAPGEMVGEQDLVDRFGLGRAGVRAALARLAVRGLVEAVPRAGWRVQPISGAMIGNVIEARRLVEPALGNIELSEVQAASARELIGVIAALVEPLEHGAAQSASREYGREALELVRSSVNPFLGNLLKDLWDQSERIVRFLEMKGGESFQVVDATAFLEAILSGERGVIFDQRAKDIDRFEEYVTARLLRDDTAIAAAAQAPERSAEKVEPKNNENGTEKWEPEDERYME